MAWCSLCNRSFGSLEALDQHTQNSPAHALTYGCGLCNRSFGSQEALDQHTQNSPAHAPRYDCNLCNQSFNSQGALDQHVQNSPAHAPSFDCGLCHRSFGSQEALDQHSQNSPAHASSYGCGFCNRSFGSQEALDQHTRMFPSHAPFYGCGLCNRAFNSQEALDQHTRSSPAHALTYDCELCNQVFGSLGALNQHIQDSPAHSRQTPTPLNAFFLSFAGFNFDPSLPPAESYRRLQRYYDWDRDDPESKNAWNDYQSALAEEFSLWFGSEDDLSAWHSLCTAVNVSPLPTTCRGCQKAVRRLYVNIVDLIEWARRGREGDRVQRFDSLKDLRNYSRRTRKIFRNDLDESGNGNVVLRHLLRFLFRSVAWSST
ncbi:hypothetical protein BDW42DRAFT_140643 [Aspergillus taichungensis]|uniref:C2H2-type domain-containing protein n=1 Tax=Aspergillus taichungensis TaxID=482145 RepID=A0A2J5HNI5_9EURO|nr:hypothetical protein BDW42DRAFT_140643 [Aspergillus taichungensis]